MDWLRTAQTELKRQGLAGWLLYSFRGGNPVFGRFVKLGFISRRTFLFVPPTGTPTLLVHTIERGSLPELPYRVRSYASHESLTQALEEVLPEGRVALEYSPNNDLPYVSFVDAGTLEMVRALGVTPVSSADLLGAFSAWTPAQVESHSRAAQHVLQAKDLAFEFIRGADKDTIRETDVQRVMTDLFDARGLEYDHAPIVGFGPHTGDPHYTPREGSDRVLQKGDAILIDLWAKEPKGDAPYADITWMGVWGEPSEELREVFEIVRDARDLGVETIRKAFDAGRRLQGCEVDRAVRDFITDRGYGEAFFHRTGHSLGTRATHGDAAHLDDFETRDTRELRPGLGLTVEPGIYLPDFGVRSEINLVLEEGGPRITTEPQRELIVLPG